MLTIDAQEVLLFNPDLDEQQVTVLIRDGLAMARRVAPCIDEEDFAYADAATAIIRSAVLRWAESGSGALTQESATAGPFAHTMSFDSRQTRRSLFFPSELRELQALCVQSSGKAFTIDTIPVHTSRCLEGNPAGCTYLFGSTSSPCTQCGELLRPGWWTNDPF